MITAIVFGGLVLAITLAITLAGWFFSVPGYRGPASDHFDGRRFQNQSGTLHVGFGDATRWMVTRKPGPWGTVRRIDTAPNPPALVGAGDLRVTFINHATTLIQMDGVNILTDPIWSDRCSPLSWMGPRRARPPGIRFQQLPHIDVVLLSHNHYDHLDLPTLRRLAREHRPSFVAPLGNREFLRRRGIPAAELDWWQRLHLQDGVALTCVPAQHFSSRGLFDRDRTLWAGFVVTGPAGTVYFAGDTGFGPHFAQVRERFGPVRLALLPIGAFRPEWFMSRVHMSPDEALEAHRILEAGTSVATHFGTFRLADDGQNEALERIEALVRAQDPAPRLWVLGFGEGRAG